MWKIIFVILKMAEIIFAQTTDNGNGFVFTDMATAHVSFDEYKVLFYYDIRALYDMTNRIEACVQRLVDACHHHQQDSCEVTTDQLQKQVRTARSDLNKLRAYEVSGESGSDRQITRNRRNIITINERRKRYICESCGYFLHATTGLLDASTVRKYDDKINQIKNATLTQHRIQESQSQIFARAMKDEEKHFNSLESSLKDLFNRYNKTREDVFHQFQFYEEKHTLDTLNNIARSMLFEQSTMISKIKQSLKSINTAEMPDLIEEELIESTLKRIKNELPLEKNLPINLDTESALQIFKFTTTKGAKSNNIVMIEVTIPIIMSEEFTLFKITPIPVKNQGKTFIMKPEAYHFLLNKDEIKLYPLDDQQIEHGLRVEEHVVMFKPRVTTSTDIQNICIWLAFKHSSLKDLMRKCPKSLIPNANYVITVNENDLYYLSLHNATRFSKNCEHEKTVQFEVNTDGIIQLDPNCTFSTKDFIIHSHNAKRINATRVIVPLSTSKVITNNEINNILSVNMTFDHDTKPFLIQNHEQFSELAKEAEILAKSSKYELDLQDIHYDGMQNSIISGLIVFTFSALIISCIATCIWRKIIFLNKLLRAVGLGFGRNDSKNNNKNSIPIVIRTDIPRQRLPKTPKPSKKSKRVNFNNQDEDIEFQFE